MQVHTDQFRVFVEADFLAIRAFPSIDHVNGRDLSASTRGTPPWALTTYNLSSLITVYATSDPKGCGIRMLLGRNCRLLPYLAKPESPI